MKRVNIAILGLGTVGQGTYQILAQNRASIQEKTGCDIQVTKIYDRSFDAKYQTLGIPASTKVTDPQEIFGDPDIAIVVESVGGVELAADWMLAALRAGKSVVTPNKAAVAARYNALMDAAKEASVQLRMEACVGGGIPVLTAITEPLAGNQFTEIMGIVNGTTNYILTKMTEEGASYEDVLKDAQAKGFAEADPTADVEGLDAANKLTILMALAMDTYIPPVKIPTRGISQITADDISAAAAKGAKIKLIAHAVKDENGQITCSVGPEELSASHPLAGVSNEYNAIYLTGNAVGEVMLYGKGAGSLPTGSAVVGDIMAIAKSL